MISNNKISNLVASELPFHVRNNHPNFVAFLEAYYEFLEQEGQVVDSSQKLLDYNDVDRTIDYFSEHLYDSFLKFIPKDIIVDKPLLVKNIQDFYRAKGTEKALKFLLRMVTGEDSSVYYPKTDILKVSDGKWFIQKSLRISGTTVNGVSNTSLAALSLFGSKRIKGGTSNSTAIVERIDRFIDYGTQIDELILSSQKGTFINGETIWSNVINNDIVSTVRANVFGGGINTVTITNPGLNYMVGDPVTINSTVGSGAVVTVSEVSQGNLLSLYVINGGAGFLSNDSLIIVGGGGSGATGNVVNVDTTETIHPNTYIIFNSIINLESNTLIGNTQYSNLNHIIVSLPNANTQIANTLNSFSYGPCGPAVSLGLLTVGSNYTSVPSIDISSNSVIRTVGILGRMQIVNGGLNYVANNIIEFNNTGTSTGYGANARVKTVAANGKITSVEFVQLSNTGYPIGGLNYTQSFLPTTNVSTSTGNGANIIVTAILGDGETLSANTSNIGEIMSLSIDSRGTDYEQTTTLDFTQIGNGQARGNLTIITGVYSYPGRYLNDDGHISGYNFIENRDYYQNYSYVVQIKNNFKNYKKAVLDLIHPSGMKLFGEYLKEYNDNPGGSNTSINDSVRIKFNPGTWSSNLGNVIINVSNHGLSVNSNTYLEFISGDTINIANNIYLVRTVSNSNTFTVLTSNTQNSTGNVSSGRIL